MRSTILRKFAYLPLLALALTSVGFAAPEASTTKCNSSERQLWSVEAEANNLLKEIKSLSGKLKNDANTLESYKWQTLLHWQTHAQQISRVREHINSIGDRLDRLQAIKSELAPWQQRAIEQIVPVAANVAAHTEAAIQHLNQNRAYLFAPVYAEHLTAIADRSSELKESADLFLEFGDTSDKLDRTQKKLDRLQERIGLSES
jgi:chromosome segregation ATPase